MHTATKKEKAISFALIVFAVVLLLLGTNLLTLLVLMASIGFGIYGVVKPFKPGTNNPFDLQAKLGALGLALVIISWVFSFFG